MNSAGTSWSPQTTNFTTSATPQLVTTLVAEGATARYLVPTNNTDENVWRAFGYDDSAWPSGASGFGLATAERFAEEGATVAILGRRADLAAYERFRQPEGLPATYRVVFGVLRKDS